jgi:hypothetical protein
MLLHCAVANITKNYENTTTDISWFAWVYPVWPRIADTIRGRSWMFTSYDGSRGEQRRQGRGCVYSTSTSTCIAYVTSQQGRVSEIRHRQSLVRRDITAEYRTPSFVAIRTFPVTISSQMSSKCTLIIILWDLRFSRQWNYRCWSSGLQRRADL